MSQDLMHGVVGGLGLFGLVYAIRLSDGILSPIIGHKLVLVIWALPMVYCFIACLVVIARAWRRGYA